MEADEVMVLPFFAKMKEDSSSDILPLTFGKYKGKTPRELIDIDPGYLVWIDETFEEGKRPFTEDLAEEAHAAVEHVCNHHRYDFCDISDIY